MNPLFDIVTLSDKNKISYRQAPVLKKYYLRHGNKLIKRKYPLNDSLGDPVSVILGGVQVIGSILPNLMGAEKATAADFEKLFPGSGFWTVKFRNYLQSAIKYKKDIPRDLLMYTVQFVADNNNSICPGTYTFQQQPGTNPGGGGASGWNPCIEKFYSILRREAATGGVSPIGNVAPGLSGINWTEMLPYAIGGIVLIVLLQSKKRK